MENENIMNFDFGEAIDEFAEYDSNSQIIEGEFEVIEGEFEIIDEQLYIELMSND